MKLKHHLVTFTWKSHNQVNTKVQFCVEDSGQLQYFNSWFMKNLAWTKVAIYDKKNCTSQFMNESDLLEPI